MKLKLEHLGTQQHVDTARYSHDSVVCLPQDQAKSLQEQLEQREVQRALAPSSVRRRGGFSHGFRVGGGRKEEHSLGLLAHILRFGGWPPPNQLQPSSKWRLLESYRDNERIASLSDCVFSSFSFQKSSR